MSRNVIVFGSDGLLAQDLIELFNYEQDVYVRGYSHQECDITDYTDIYNILGGTKGSISQVINCTAFTDVDKAETNEKLAFKINDQAIKTLSELCVENEIHLTHISTNFVFEGLKNEPYLEQDETNPLSVYGKSKLAGEGHVRAMGDKGLVIRTAWLYGKGKRTFIDNILDKLELGSNVNVIDDQIATPTYTMDLSNVIIQLSLGLKSGLFHVTNSGFCSMYKFASEAAKFLEYNSDRIRPIKTSELNMAAVRPKYSALSLIRLGKTLTEPIRSWKDALYQYLLETKRLYE